jgi:hypothetical protein
MNSFNGLSDLEQNFGMDKNEIKDDDFFYEEPAAQMDFDKAYFDEPNDDLQVEIEVDENEL